MPNDVVIDGDSTCIKLGENQWIRWIDNYNFTTEKDVLRYRICAKIKDENGNEIKIDNKNQYQYEHPLNGKCEIYKGRDFWQQPALQDLDFTDASLQCIDSRVTKFTNVNFTRADLNMAKFNNADLSGVDFTGAELYNADLFGAKNLDKVKSWQGCIINHNTKLPESFKFPAGMIVKNRKSINNYKNRLPENQGFDMNGMVFDKSIKRNALSEEPQKPEMVMLEKKPESRALKTHQIIIETKGESKIKQCGEDPKNKKESLISDEPPTYNSLFPKQNDQKTSDKNKQTPQSSKFEFESCTWIETALKLILNRCFGVYKSFTAKYEESKKSQKNDNKQI